VDKLSFTVTDLDVGYKNFRLSKVNFELKEGSILGIVGASGSGKSTIIKAIVGQRRPDMGTIMLKVNGESVHLNDYLGYSPQQNSFYPYLSVEENVMTFASLNRVENYVAEGRMDALLKRLDLYEHKRKRINQLSGGMQKRVDLAVTLIHSPKVIILDEPFNGLDVSMQRFIWSLLQEMSSVGKIIIVSSHMLVDISKNCTEYGLVHNSTYYRTDQIRQALGTNRLSFEAYMESLFANYKK
jgi:ABC-2 type transport system ATP-binding protein